MSLEGGVLKGEHSLDDTPGYIKMSPDSIENCIAGSLEAVTEFVNTIEAATLTA